MKAMIKKKKKKRVSDLKNDYKILIFVTIIV